MTISKKTLALFVQIKELKARLDELQALRPSLNSSKYYERKKLLENKIAELEPSKEDDSNLVLNITIVEKR